MFSLRTPRYSFIQLTHRDATQCPAEEGPCLPIYALDDLRFLVTATVTGDDLSWFQQTYETGGITYQYTVYAKICQDCDEELTPEEFLASAFEYQATWTLISEEDDQQEWAGSFLPSGDNSIFDDLPAGACWQLCFYRVTVPVLNPTDIVGGSYIKKACTYTCFKKIDDMCFTTRFRYQNNEDAFDFLYENSGHLYNVVRLSAHLRDMQLPSDQKSYTKSDGTKVKLFERIEEDYELVIDWMPKQMQKAFKVMLAHDELLLTNVNEGFTSFQRFICDEKYDIRWPDEPFPQAMAKTRIKRAEPLSLINSNCR